MWCSHMKDKPSSLSHGLFVHYLFRLLLEKGDYSEYLHVLHCLRASALCTCFYINPASVIIFMQSHYCTSKPRTGADDAFVLKCCESRDISQLTGESQVCTWFRSIFHSLHFSNLLFVTTPFVHQAMCNILRHLQFVCGVYLKAGLSKISNWCLTVLTWLDFL